MFKQNILNSKNTDQAIQGVSNVKNNSGCLKC